jgi:chemotaxis signal transduction protein
VNEPHELYAVLITLPGGATLLLPKLAVVEVLSADVVQPAADAPAWIAGRCNYNGRSLPVVNFEALVGTAPDEPGPRTRVAVMHGISGKLPSGQYALLGRGYPHLVTLNRNAVVVEPGTEEESRELVLAQVKIANTAAGIPDLDALEDHLARLEAD